MATLKQTVEDLDAWYNSRASEINRLAQKYIRKGYTIDTAIKKAMADVNLESLAVEKYSKAAGSLIATTAVGIEIDRSTMARSWATKAVGGKNLSERIYGSVKDYQKSVIREVSASMSKINSWKSLAYEVRGKVNIAGDLPKYMTDLVAAARRAGLSPSEMAAYKKLVAKAQRNIDTLATGGAGQGRLKAAYQGVVTATEKGSVKAIDRSIERAIVNKAQYNAERLARTEMAAAYNESVKINLAEDPDAIGYKSVLSPAHNIDDICDFYANADLHGLGAGVFPKNEGPPLPYHPHCMCSAVLVYKERPTGKDASAYIDKASDKKLKGIFGKHGAAVVKENPSAWRSYMKNYQPFESKKPTTI